MSDFTRLEISEVVYECVSSTELQDMDREKVDMMMDICDTMRDHEFRTNTHRPLQRTGSDSVKIRSSRAVPVCLVLLCVLLLTAVTVLCVHIYTKSTHYTEERDQLLNKITSITEERDQLLTNITNFKEERDQLLTNNTNLTEDRDQLQITNKALKTEKDDLIQLLNDGWIYYQFSFYYISSEKKSWTESRRYCTDRGADLIIINNREKQDFIKNISGSALAWIGLTDSDVEGTWKWVDGTSMTSGFWRSGEPNGGRRENCALTYSTGWADYPCDDPCKWKW